MVLILLEALLALSLLVLIVWWTMFSGRSNGELPEMPEPDDDKARALPAPPSGPAPGTGTGVDDPAARP
jgi:hypothetical protein